MTINKDIYPF